MDMESDVVESAAAKAELAAVVTEFDIYMHLDLGSDQAAIDQAQDVRRWLRQCMMTHQRIAEGLLQYRELPHAPTAPEFMDAMMERIAWVQMDVETFYRIAGRVRTAARKLPGLDGFDPPGVRDVRNHLIEHTEGKGSRVFGGGISVGGGVGAVLKPMRRAGSPDGYRDRGLYPNLLEFTQEFRTALRSVRESSRSTQGLAGA